MGKTKSVKIVPELVTYDAAVTVLLDTCFGADRTTRAVYRLRDGRAPDARLSFVALDEQHQVVGTIRYWPVWVAADGHITTQNNGEPAALLGPIAVSEKYQNLGLGEKIIRHSLTAARLYYPIVLLVGPLEYYGRFGFSDQAALSIAELEPGKRVLSLKS